ncbi:MAG: ABC transporter permease [Gemmatimonadota bacterium]
MSVAAVLARNEFLKTRKRRAFWVGLGLLALIATLGFGEDFLDARREGDGSFALPGAWSEILGEPTQVPLIFGAVVLILLAASEFSWRTGRQNVIDGLTRGQWYWGKTFAVVLTALAFVGMYISIGGTLALMSTDLGSGDGIVRAGQLQAIGAVVLSYAGYASLALLVATTVRSTGGAMAIWFFYVAFGETLLRGGIGKLWEGARPYLTYLPIASFDQLRNYLMFDPDRLAVVTAARLEAGRAAPTVGDASMLALVAAAWATAFVVIGFLAFRRRDI